MKKVTYIAGLAGMVPLAAGFMAPAAHAAQAGSAEPQALTTGKTVSLHNVRQAPLVDHVYHCSAGGGYHCWAPIIHGPAPFTSHNGAVLSPLHDGSMVEITCYYTGTKVHGDPYKDHVTGIISRNGQIGDSANGHVSDYYVNLSSQNPSRVGLGIC